ncbi:MAG: cation-translocating P-type ATPase [Minisyncoccales bacterium]
MNGLDEKTVLQLRKKYGENIILGEEKSNWFSILVSQLKNPLVYILFFVGFISLIFREIFDFILIMTVIVLNTLMGFFQEYNAKRTLSTLRKMLRPLVMVIREGKKKIIEAKDLVPGDLVVLISGDKIGADGKLIQGEILVSEAVFTGEEEGVLKKQGDKVFLATQVLAGKAVMEVEKIGKETEIGKMGKLLVEIKEEKTPLQKKLANFSKDLAKIIIIICLFIFLVGVLNEGSFLGSFKIATVLAVAAIPEALPVALTVILALGMKRILKRKGLVKTLLASETLGSTSVICLDKTGTLTEGKMKVLKGEFEDKEKALRVMLLNNEEKTSLEIALANFAKENLKDRIKGILQKTKETFEEPFDSEKKYSMSIWEIEKKEISLLTGAPEIILEFCQIEKLKKEKYLKILDFWAEEGLRVVGFAEKENGNLKEKKNFKFLGVVGILDPVRKEAKEMIKVAQNASIKIKIVTGDYRKTAEKLIKILGLEIRPENIMEGWELEEISIEDLKKKIDKIILFCRVTPHQKRKIIDALQQKNEIVAMTGDGVNDALALKEADIGIAVGEATEVSKEAADLVLLDSNFKTIISACEEGRLILSNIKKTIGYALSNSFVEIGVLFLAGLLRFPAPLSVVQILYLHLICDGPPDLMFAFEPAEKDLMKRKPVDVKKEPILDKLLLFNVIAITLFASTVSLLLFWEIGIKNDNLKLASTLVFAIFGTVDLIYAISFKNLTKPIFKMENLFSNKFLFFGIFYAFLFLFLAIYFPPLNKILNTVPLEAGHWLMVIGVGILTTLILELIKTLTFIFSKNKKI